MAAVIGEASFILLIVYLKLAMSTTSQTPHIEILERHQEPTNPHSIVIREIDLPKYYIEQTRVIVEPKPDSTLLVVFSDGELKGTEMIAPSYSFRTIHGASIVLTSRAGMLTHTTHIT
jgi:hypothetical protein